MHINLIQYHTNTGDPQSNVLIGSPLMAMSRPLILCFTTAFVLSLIWPIKVPKSDAKPNISLSIYTAFVEGYSYTWSGDLMFSRTSSA